MLTSPLAEVAGPVRRRRRSDGRRPQVRHVAKKLNRTLAVSVFQFAICRTHPAQRLDFALDALCDSRTLARSQLQQRFFPNPPYSSLTDAERFLLRDDANAEFAVRIHCERIHPPRSEEHTS